MEDDKKTVRDFIGYAARKFARAKLTYGHGTTNAEEEAVFLILETLGINAPEAHSATLRRKVDAQTAQKLEAIITERIHTRKPAAYLLNKAYIQGVPFYVDERVIVPRSYLGEILCNDIDLLIPDVSRVKSILDLCTGSGCLAILAAQIFPKAKIDAVDLSGYALEVAKVNVDRHGFDKRIRLLRGDLFEPVKDQSYDLIIANPPYVGAAEMKHFPKEYRHEPVVAHDGGADGMTLVRKIIDQADAHLNRNGALLCEIGLGYEVLEQDYPQTPFVWLDTQESSAEVFWLPRQN